MSDEVTQESKDIAASVGLEVQPDPVANNNPSAHDLVMADLEEGRRFTEPTHEFNLDDIRWIFEHATTSFVYLVGDVDTAIEEMEKRKQFGLKKYGTILQPHNGRNNKQDAIDEMGDLLVYLRCMYYEQTGE